MSSKMFFVNEKEEALAEKNPKLFQYYITLETKLSFEKWLENRQKMMEIIHSLGEDFCQCSYYGRDCTEQCNVVSRQKLVQITVRICSITEEQLQFYDLMTFKSKVDSCKEGSAPLASRYILDSRDRNS